jgi:hypothetical protein
MVQYGSAGGFQTPNITVSPTFSNIGNPDIAVEGMSVGDVTLSNTSNTRPGGTTGRNQPNTQRPGTQRPGTQRTGTQGPGGRRTEGGGEEIGTTLNVSKALKEAMRTGQSKNPRVTKGELKDIYKESGLGAAGFRDYLYENKVKGAEFGGKATDFLNRQLEKAGEKPMPKQTTIKTPDPRETKKQPENTGVVGLINKAGQPGTTNMKQTQPKKQQASKAEAKKKAEAKAKNKKKK